ncbi:imidazole glycerol phosphate synthase subunit HisF [archaeon]|jgi:imidazole glycerol-phosphate synthase subunit HisF|nr:imidazole glycerol phosphate synthase subunit HisF [archaeon]MBT6761820.1 imidazole glycerol phosphate synthase subunit HisF [archaeon]
MLKKRVIACLVIKNGIVVQSIGFEKYLPVGIPEIAVEFLNSWGIDEIVLLDIDATLENREPDFEMIKRISKKCFVPLTIGGGIKSVAVMKKLIRTGADKIAINSLAVNNPSLISEAAAVLGKQCIVVSIDAKCRKREDGIIWHEVMINNGKEGTGLDVVNFSKKCEELGAGEIIVNSIDNDGSKNGLDIELIRSVSSAVSIPVIAIGGVGHPEHFAEGFIQGNAMAVAAANYFHFTEHSPIIVKEYLMSYTTIRPRHETYINYEGFSFNKYGRIKKREEDYLDKTRFEYHPEEII